MYIQYIYIHTYLCIHIYIYIYVYINVPRRVCRHILQPCQTNTTAMTSRLYIRKVHMSTLRRKPTHIC